jgi:ethanolamine-phosphate cytidylyltransferase
VPPNTLFFVPTAPHCLQIKRTEGVSTTDIVGRMLMCSRDNVRFSAEDRERLTREFSMGAGPDTGR